MERRANPRHPLNLGALFAINQNEYQRCIIRDFCIGGMFLAYPQPANGAAIKRNDKVQINLTLTLAQQPENCFLQAKVARVFPHGIGVSFINPDRQVLQHLQHLAQPVQPEPMANPVPLTTAAQTNQYIQAIHEYLSSMLLMFFDEASTALFKAANTASSNTEQNHHLEAIREIKKLQRPIETLFIDPILQQLKSPSLTTPKPTSRLDELSLVAQDEFEDWLNVANLISKAEIQYEEILLDLQPRLSQVFNVKFSKDNLPVGPAVLCHAFHQASQNMEAHTQTKKIIYQVFEKTFVSRLLELYQHLQTLLDQQGITRTKHKLSVTKSPAPPLAETTLTSPQPAINKSAIAFAASSTENSAYQALHQLTQLTQTSTGLSAELATLLQPILPKTALAPQQQQVITSVDQLLAAIGTDQRLTQPVQLWFKDLRLPALQLAMNQPQLVTHAANPLQQTLDHLAELGQLITSEDRVINTAIKQQIETIIGQLVNSKDLLHSFTDATTQLQPLLERQRKNYHRNLERVTQTCDGKYKLIQSRKLVEQALIQQFTNRPIPVVVFDLLETGWRDFLVLLHVRKGSHDPQWQQQLKLLKQLLLAFQHIPLTPQQLDILLPALQNSLNQPGSDKLKQHELLEQLHELLTGKAPVKRCPYTATITTPQSPLPAGDNTHWLRQAAKLTVGDWLEITTDEVTRPARLAWVSHDKEQFALVNRQGLQIAELSRAEMAQQLAKQQRPALDADMNTMDRAMYAMFQQMYEQLAYQSTHDALTGLLNRKAFEERVIPQLRQINNNQPLLAYLDIDQFKVINNTCSHHAGDLALQQIAQLLQQQLPPHAILARLGGDEFGIFLVQADFTEGCRLIEQQRQQIEALRFAYDGRIFSHTVSIGIVAVVPESADITQLFRAADESCYAAKNAGRNRIQVYQSNDAELSHRRTIMQWVSEISRTIEQDRLKLRCQRIAPISDANLTPHYEVLLSVLDKNGVWLPPVEFIQAAESYQRMTLVDQWVVETTLNWLDQHLGVLDTLGGLAINLSGQSLTDPNFLQFILNKFKTIRVPPHKICFEVTETVAISNFNQGLAFMQDIRALGCEFALDDFGSGLSSYAYLKNMPVDYLKIDGAFIKDVLTNTSDQAMVKSINEISHVMGKKTIAEFVTNQEILRYLQTIGVDFAQGYGVEKPRILFEMDNR